MKKILDLFFQWQIDGPLNNHSWCMTAGIPIKRSWGVSHWRILEIIHNRGEFKSFYVIVRGYGLGWAMCPPTRKQLLPLEYEWQYGRFSLRILPGRAVSYKP